MAQDGFVDWLRDTFSADPGGFDDLFTNDQKVAITLPVQQTQQLLPDTAVLIQQMETSLTQDDIPELADIMAIQDCDAAAQHSPSYSKAASAKAGSQRPKNTKRYKSLAQKEAHKRYRERKRASITAMEATVQEMLQQLRELEVENEQLKSRCRVLETSVNCSTQIHEIMQLLEGMNGMSLNPDGSSSPASGSSGPHAFGMQSRDRRSSTTASDTSGGDTWSSGSGFACPQQQQQHQAIPVLQQQQQVPLQQQQQQQQPQQDPWQRMAQTRVITTGAVNNPAAAAAGNGTMAEVLQLNRFTRTWSGHSTSVSQQQRLAPLMGNNGSNGRSTSGYAPAIAVAAAPAGPAPADYNSSSNSLQAIFAEVAQQQSAATAASRSGDVGGSPYCSSGGSSNPLAGAVTSEEQGLGMYKEFLRQASQLMLQTDSGGIGAESARTTLEDLTRVTMSRFQPFLVAKGQGLVYSWITRNLETGQHQEPPEELWPKVLEQMHLSPQQQRDALACYRMFSICLSKLVDKRVELSAQYKAIQQHSEQCELIAQQPQQGKLEAAADYRKSKLTSASMEVLQSLAKNLAAYQSLDGVFAHSVTSLLTGVQMATACVHSYPFLPQWHTMMRYLQWQEEASQQAAQQQQQAGPGHAPRRSNRGGRAAHQVATSALKA